MCKRQRGSLRVKMCSARRRSEGMFASEMLLRDASGDGNISRVLDGSEKMSDLFPAKCMNFY